jgi:hypothetical protein
VQIIQRNKRILTEREGTNYLSQVVLEEVVCYPITIHDRGIIGRDCMEKQVPGNQAFFLNVGTREAPVGISSGLPKGRFYCMRNQDTTIMRPRCRRGWDGGPCC